MAPEGSTSPFRIWRLCNPGKPAERGDRSAADCAASPPQTAVCLVPLLLFLLLGALVSVTWINATIVGGGGGGSWPSATTARADQRRAATGLALNSSTAPLSCRPSPPPDVGEAPPTSAACPAYFRWIHEDLRPWAVSGVTREMVERAKGSASFRLVVLGGRAFVESYGRRTFQTRDLFTQWGILQLLRRYPGGVPDLELMFDCADQPAVSKAAYPGDRAGTTAPPVFGYCGDDSTADIVFPDWSFWGWPEINVKPWELLIEDLKGANGRLNWVDREPHAFWKGNPSTSAGGRRDLLRCNVSAAHDWGARLYAQDWGTEIKQGFRNSGLADQCKHRYNIYIEGNTWSVSEKYILACDSVALVVTPRYHDFFSRGVLPLRHYWPVRSDDKCPSAKFAVDWGNSHPEKAQEMGKRGSGFVQEELKMDSVYDYMFHLLNQYASLQTFRPTKPPGAVELLPEAMVSRHKGLAGEFMEQSTVKAPRGAGPCALPPPFSPAEMRLLMAERADSTAQVESWEREARAGAGQKP